MKNYKNYKGKSIEEKKEEVENLLKIASKKVDNYFVSEESMKEYLSFMSKFYNYSFRNVCLIQQQFKGAMAVGSFLFWKEKGFTVKKGEKGIKILVPIKTKPKFFINDKWVLVENATEEQKEDIKKGNLKVTQGIYFKVGSVFDISQTTATAKDLPKIFPSKWLDGDVENYDILYKAMEKIAQEIEVRIVKPINELGAAKGICYPGEKIVALNQRNSELQNVKTLLHELTHAKLHTIDKFCEYTTAEKEFQAEMTAYTICSYLGIDTSDYSLSYIHDWSKRGIEDKEKLLKEVRETALYFIDIIEGCINKNEEEQENKIS